MSALTCTGFDDLTQAAALIEAWRRNYNESSPHTGLNNLPPAEYATRSRTRSEITGFSAVQI
jgi:putative transposase